MFFYICICKRGFRAHGSTRGGALTVSSGWASRPPSEAPRARLWTRPCTRATAGRFRPSLRAPRGARAPGSAGHDQQRGRRRVNRLVTPAKRPARCAHARKHRSATPAPPRAQGGGRRRGSGGTHRYSKSLHWPSDSGSAVTLVEKMDLPRTARIYMYTGICICICICMCICTCICIYV